MVVKIYIQDVQIDLFADENIEIKSSIANVNNISKNTTDYSKSFTVPASNNNNSFFKHYYNANIDNTFDARVKVDGYIELDGMPFKYGKWRLEKVNVKQGDPSSYTITFFGNLVSLKDKFGNDELTDLDFTALDFAYNDDYVYDALRYSTTAGVIKDIIFSLFTKMQLYYNPTTGGKGNLATTGVNWRELIPSMRLEKIIEAIEIKYDIVFSREFFGSTQFTDLYMLLNASSDIVAATTRQLVTFSEPQSMPYLDVPTDTLTYASPLEAIDYTITPQGGYYDEEYTFTIYRNGIPFRSSGVVKGIYYDSFWPVPGGDYTFYVEAAAFSYIVRIKTYDRYVSGEQRVKYVAPSDIMTITPIFQITNNLPKIKVLDFMAGLFKAFKLVVIADEYDNVYINTLENYYLRGGIHDVTSYIDNSSYDVSRGDILNDINFKFQEPKTILNKQFDVNTGLPYGDENAQITDELGKPLDGTSLSIELPFEQIVYEKLQFLPENYSTKIQVATLLDEELKAVNPKPHIHYNVNTLVSPYKYNLYTDTILLAIYRCNIMSYSETFTSPAYAFLFSEEFDTYTGALTSNNLYTNYWQNYVTSLFNIKRRSFKYKAHLPLSLMLKLQLNSALKIRDNYYRINSYTINLISGETSLDLINSFDESLTPFTAYPTEIGSNSLGRKVTVTFTNLSDYTLSAFPPLLDTILEEENRITFGIGENLGSDIRYGELTVTDNITGHDIIIYFTQDGATVTADTTYTTVDITNITADNN